MHHLEMDPSRQLDGLTQPKEGTISKAQLDSVVGTISQVLQQDEVLGPVLTRRQTDILARIETLLIESSAAGE